ncbi:hypothetical protein C7N43_29790 [Sphingobacteriales bacterium UPWRP_1]|nr:hypothetical protein B6N25_12525 [Sphingobacteriales bacterium TSM_CSS]PSJ73294.1 hypothetical protein C7N43_29790 [Sphingobacteriales bacterium UPWRP_1]
MTGLLLHVEQAKWLNGKNAAATARCSDAMYCSHAPYGVAGVPCIGITKDCATKHAPTKTAPR